MGADYGEPIQHDPDFSGPMKNRSCTDIICFLLFLVFLGGWAFVGYYAYSRGDVQRLLAPTDSEGRKCGLDSTVQHLPYLVFFDITRCLSPDVPVTGCPTPQVCVSNCPNESLIVTDAVINEATTNQVYFRDLLQKLPCDRRVDKNTITNMDTLLPLILNGQCAHYILKSESVLLRCLGDLSPLACRNQPQNPTPKSKYLLSKGTEDSCIRNPDVVMSSLKTRTSVLHSWVGLVMASWISYFSKNEDVQTVGTKIIEDLVASAWYMLAALIVGLLICMIYIALLRWFAAILVWFSIIGLTGILTYSIYLCYVQYAYFRDNPVQLVPSGPNLVSAAQSILDQKETWIVLMVVLSVVLLIILLTVIFLRKRIVIAIALIKEGSKAVSSIKSTYAFPIFPWILQCGIVVLAVAIALYLGSVGETNFRIVGLSNDTDCQCTTQVQDYSYCIPDEFNENCRSISAVSNNSGSTICREATCHYVGITSTNLVTWFHVVNVVGFFWLIFFIQGISEMMLASTFATWYWSFKKSDVPFFALTAGVWRSFRYHMGTVAFGALIITICRLIRVILEYIDNKMKKFDNFLTRAVMCCCKCFFACLESFLRFINKNAYIMCAVHGKNFFSSAKDAFNLLMRNIIRVFVLDKVTDFLFFLSKLLVATGVGLLSYFVLTTRELYQYTGQQQLHYNLVPVIIVTLATYLIACVFFDVYSMAVDTLFLCFLEDCERNDGSPEKPYFMSKNLMKILGKKNKFD